MLEWYVSGNFIHDNLETAMFDNLEIRASLTGETKNCLIYEPEEGEDLVSKLYIRKSAIGVKSSTEAPEEIVITINNLTD